MEKEFVPYEQALVLKELGFDEPCMCFQYDKNSIVRFVNMSDSKFNNLLTYTIISNNPTLIWNNDQVLKPTYSQAFEFFRDKYKIYIQHDAVLTGHSQGHRFNLKDSAYLSIVGTTWCKIYEEAELECLKKLIEIVKEKK